MNTQILSNIFALIVAFIVIKANNDFITEVKNSRDFTGKVILVTGSDSGIGKTTVKLFSALGAKVVVTGRNPITVNATAKEVQSVSPKGLEPLQVIADVTKEQDIEHLFNETIKTFGKLDALVNNVGSFVFTSINSPDLMNKLENNLNIDVRPALKLIRLSIPYLKETKGSIINTASILTEVPQKDLLTYVIAKETLKKVTEVLVQEISPLGIRINTISPGSIDSHGKEDENIIRTTPLGRMGQPEDIARVIVFLVSSDAKFITGANIDVDGGLRYNISGSFILSGEK